MSTSLRRQQYDTSFRFGLTSCNKVLKDHPSLVWCSIFYGLVPLVKNGLTFLSGRSRTIFCCKSVLYCDETSTYRSIVHIARKATSFLASRPNSILRHAVFISLFMRKTSTFTIVSCPRFQLAIKVEF